MRVDIQCRYDNYSVDIHTVSLCYRVDIATVLLCYSVDIQCHYVVLTCSVVML